MTSLIGRLIARVKLKWHRIPPFDDEAKSAMHAANQAAASSNYATIGCYHILYGLIVNPEGSVSKYMSNNGIARDNILTQLIDRLPYCVSDEDDAKRKVPSLQIIEDAYKVALSTNSAKSNCLCLFCACMLHSDVIDSKEAHVQNIKHILSGK